MHLLALHKTVAAFALLGAAALAHANPTHASFVDVAGSVSADGWNQLNRNRVDADGNLTPLTTEQLVAGTAANVPGSGDGVLTRVSGDHYPAGFGLYGGNSVLTFTDATVAGDLSALVFQGIINNFAGAPFGLTLSVNGGSQALLATSSSFVDTGTVADYYTYSWDLSALTTPITSYALTLTLGFSQALAFQVDQVSAVPEAGTLAMMLAGGGVLAFVGRRRRHALA